MTRYAIDAVTALRLVADGIDPGPAHSLVGPSLLRSEALSALYRSVRSGELDAVEGRRRLSGIATMRIRLLGDRVSRQTAWRIAEEHGWDDTRDAEYLAVATLQADALVALDPRLAALAEGIVPLAPLEELRG